MLIKINIKENYGGKLEGFIELKNKPQRNTENK